VSNRAGPFEGSQFLVNRSRTIRRSIENEQGEPVLFVVTPRRLPSLFPCRLAAFYDTETRERLIELRPEPWSGGARHRLVDAAGTLIARFQLEPLRARWVCRDAEGRRVADAALRPRLAAVALLSRARAARLLVIERTGDVEPGPAGVLELRSPDFDGHDLLDLPGPRETRFDARIALALSVLVS
jgi:hypothetical protein